MSDKNKNSKEEKYKLPIAIIKRDLMKTFIYAVFAVALLLTFHFVGIDKISSMLEPLGKIRVSLPRL